MSFRKNSGLKTNENRKFLFYCVYAFGCPVLISFLAYILDHTENLAQDYKIGIVNGNCFVQNNKIALVIYIFFPISSVLLFNITFYSFTALKIFKVTKEISTVQKRENGQSSRVNSNKARWKKGFSLIHYFWNLTFSIFFKIFLHFQVFRLSSIVHHNGRVLDHRTSVIHCWGIFNTPLIWHIELSSRRFDLLLLYMETKNQRNDKKQVRILRFSII